MSAQPLSFRATIGLGPSSVDFSKKTALIVIDAQGTYATGSPLAITGIDASQAKIAEAVKIYRSKGTSSPVFWIQHSAGAGAPVFDPKTEGLFGFIGDVKPVDGEKIITKGAPSSFTGTSLDADLKAAGIEQIVLTGYMAHVCVTGTARAGMELGYDVVILKDAIGDRNVPSVDGKSVVTAQYLVDAVCAELGDAIGTILNVADIKA